MFSIFREVVKKYGKRVILPCIFVLIVFLYFLLPQEDESEETLLTTIPQTDTQSNQEESSQFEQSERLTKIIVDIKGAVQHPGVYEFTEEDRIIDAISEAGGYTDDANTQWVNHARKLEDEMVLYIPKKGEDIETIQNTLEQKSDNVTGASTSSNGKININKADESELMTLSGIGPSKAKAIIEHREEHGPFKTIEDIQNISGIGEKTFEKLKDSISVN